MPKTLHRSVFFVLVGQNVQDLPDMSRPDTRATIREAARGAHVVTFQEMQETEDDQDMDLALNPTRWAHYHRATENAIGVSKLKFRGANPEECRRMGYPGGRQQGVTKLHGGKKGRSPWRCATWCAVVFKEYAEGDPVVIVDAHFVSKPGADAWGRAMARLSVVTLSALLWRLSRGGSPVVVQADFNQRRPRLVCPGLRWVYAGRLDGIAVVNPRKRRWSLISHGVFSRKTPSDHDAVGADLEARPFRVTWKTEQEQKGA